MRNDRYRQEREEIKELLTQYDNLRNGRTNSFIEQEGFERLIDYFEEYEKLQEALVVCEYAINQYPSALSLLLSKAHLLICTKDYGNALDILNEAELLDATGTDLYILKTDAYLALDMQEKAAEILEAAIENFEGGEKIDLLFELSDVYDDYENFEKVFDCIVLILKQDPTNEEALFKMCFWTDFTGRNEESIVLHKEIIEEQPYNELAWFNLGAAYQGLKLHEKALDAYAYVIAINEKFENAYRNMGDAFLRLRNYKEAIESLQKTLELTMPDAVVYEAIGHCYDRLKNYAQARFYYKKASHLDAEDAKLHYKIASTYMNEHAWQSALKCLSIALRTNRMQPDYNLALGQCYLQLNNIDEALACFGNVVRMRPKNISGWTELLKCLLQAEFFDEGIEYAEFAYEQTDHKPIFIFFLSIFLLANGQLKEATIQLENGMQANPKLLKKYIQLNPAVLKYQAIVEIISRYKKKK
ncbi:MAG: tetratricopeptide repeat protein [Ferruginibacter sp.]|nr:tetratricopeptide repeat protein [Ferruginibacter sp.]